MMHPEATITPLELTEIVGELSLPCEYGDQFKCGPSPAGWEMRLACGCGNTGVRLACTDCKDKWLTADSAAECPSCGDITAPARHLFWLVNPL